MANKKKRKKSEGRKPTLAPYISGPFKVYSGKDDKYEGQVLTSGIIKINEREFTSPSAAASHVTGVATDGWRFWKYNKDGSRVPLDTLRGKESPLKVVEEKPKTKRKPRAKKVKEVSAEAAA